MAQPALYGVVGHPVTHSLSPRIHAFWYEQLGTHAIYSALDMIEGSARDDIQALARAGFSGLNVTLPHKISAFEACSELSDAASKIGAVNTLIRKDVDQSRIWLGDNTDWTGFLWSLDRVLTQPVKNVVLIGAGGAARAVAFALKSRGMQITLLNRTVEKAKTLAEELDLDITDLTDLQNLSERCASAPLVVNTISLGHSGGKLSLPETQSGVFIDISYGVAADATLKTASENGWTTEDGLPMLIGQAADAFKLWFGVDPDRESALDAARNWLKS